MSGWLQDQKTVRKSRYDPLIRAFLFPVRRKIRTACRTHVSGLHASAGWLADTGSPGCIFPDGKKSKTGRGCGRVELSPRDKNRSRIAPQDPFLFSCRFIRILCGSSRKCRRREGFRAVRDHVIRFFLSLPSGKGRSRMPENRLRGGVARHPCAGAAAGPESCEPL